ncbi:DUF4087 domain-containing protein [Ancylothrix sp. D3o]|uniref:DUF4087 domain-containing protein n=1 Tax=Ancylothrix sp. D3o TaxID=2953691 RepID=UPI0021BB7B8F|nr:DUF4087 domain-containing protein [Ancylothrix sp. D3o]
MNKKNLFCILSIFSTISIFSLPSNATETRCGWLMNPTPANWYLKDSDGTWIISSQGGTQAKGMENLPNLNENQYVRTNGYYGYGCACLQVITDTNQMRIKKIESGEALPLKTCKEDPNLPSIN